MAWLRQLPTHRDASTRVSFPVLAAYILFVDDPVILVDLQSHVRPIGVPNPELSALKAEGWVYVDLGLPIEDYGMADWKGRPLEVIFTDDFYEEPTPRRNEAVLVEPSAELSHGLSNGSVTFIFSAKMMPNRGG